MLNKPSATGASTPRAPNSDPIFALIDKHRQLESEFSAACAAEDEAMGKSEDVKAAANKQWRHASNRADKALRRLASTVPISAAGVEARASYFAKLELVPEEIWQAFALSTSSSAAHMCEHGADSGESDSEIEIEYRRYARLSAEFGRLFWLQDEREKAYDGQLPKRPDALRWTKADIPLCCAVEHGEKHLFVQCEGRGRQVLDEIIRGDYPCKMKKRASEVLDADAAWRRQCKKLRKEVGLEQLEKDLAKIDERYSATGNRIYDLPVRSLRDAAFKGLVLSIVVADDRAERFFFELAALCGIPRLPETEGLGEPPESPEDLREEAA